VKRGAWLLLMVIAAVHAEAPPPAGTVIVGEQEAAIGLTLTPWQEEYASDLDRPPATLDVPPQPLDAQAFHRLSEFREASLGYRREQLQRAH